MYKLSCEYRVQFHLGKYVGVGSQGHMVRVCVTLYKAAKLFHSGFYFLILKIILNYEHLFFLHIKLLVLGAGTQQ